MNTMRLLRLSTLGPLSGLVILSILAFFNQRSVNQAQANRYESLKLAYELRASSDELTRLARTYVVTGSKAYEDQYWYILDVRNGRKVRPDGRTVPLRKLMQEQGFSAEEFAKLKQAEDNSNALVTTETIAMNAIKGRFADGMGGYTRQGVPNLDLARRIMHDSKYPSDKKLIMDPIGEFENLLDRRTEATAENARRLGDSVMIAGMLIASTAAISTWFSLRHHSNKLHGAIEELSSTSGFVATGASQVASSSRYLADGASEQVVALEDITRAAEIPGSHRATGRNGGCDGRNRRGQ